jgi:hypothetical protein
MRDAYVGMILQEFAEWFEILRKDSHAISWYPKPVFRCSDTYWTLPRVFLFS